MSAPTSSAPAPVQASGPVSVPPPVSQQQMTPASLYIGELEPSVTEAMLFKIFNMVGPVASIRVCHHAVTRRPLGYAYVNFHNIADGERALETLNYTLIKGKACRIMWSQRDPALRKTGSGNIFIKNLDPTIDNKALHDIFSAFGNILSCKVVTEDGMSKGFGFVHYETYEAAEDAINHVNGMLLDDKKVFVGHHVPKKERQSKVEEMKSTFTNVYVKNLDLSVTTEELLKKFAAFGPVTSCVVSADENGVSRGFGFVNFDDHESANRAVDALNDLDWKEKKLFVSRAQKKGEREEELKMAKMEKLSKYQGVNLYIKNLEDTVDDEKLRQEFSIWGVITSAKVMRDEKGTSKGFGFVCFSSPDEATKAVTEMKGRMVGQKPIYVALAQRKDVRKNQLEAQLNQRNQMRLQQQAAVQGGIPGGPMYPGAPMYFAGPQPGFPQARGFIPGQAGMPPRPRWGPNGQQQPMMPGMPPQAYPNMPMQFNSGMFGNIPGGRPQPAPRQNSRGGPAQQQGPGAPPSGPPQSRGPNSTRGGFKYNPSARNQPPTSGGAPSSGSTPASSTGSTWKPGLTAAAFASAPPEAQKQMLGEQIYPLIASRQPDIPGKITAPSMPPKKRIAKATADNRRALIHTTRSHTARLSSLAQSPISKLPRSTPMEIPELIQMITGYLSPSRRLELQHVNHTWKMHITFTQEEYYDLFQSASWRDLRIVERILEDQRMDPTLKENYPLRWACENNYWEYVELILRDPRVDPSANGNQALKIACRKGSLKVVDYLLQDTRVDPGGNTFALFKAVEGGHLDVVNRLLQDPRVDPSIDDSYAIRLATGCFCAGIVERLLQDPRVDPSSDNNCAVNTAYENDSGHIFHMLLKDPRVSHYSQESVKSVKREKGGRS